MEDNQRDKLLDGLSQWQPQRQQRIGDAGKLECEPLLCKMNNTIFRTS